MKSNAQPWVADGHWQSHCHGLEECRPIILVDLSLLSGPITTEILALTNANRMKWHGLSNP